MPVNEGRLSQRPHGRGLAAEELRRHNLASVLTPLHFAGPLSRSDLVARTGLNRSTIAALIGELAELGLVEEGTATTTSGPGRPSQLVHPNPPGAVVLVVELAVDSIAVATFGLGGHVYNRVRVARPREHLAPEEAVGHIANLARPLLSSLPGNHRFVGVGVAIVGVTRRSDGYLHLAPNLGWRDVPLGALLAEALDIEGPVSVANEADLAALAEYRRGTCQNVRNLIYVSGEVGIGVGIIANGEPLLGAAGYSGEAGHTLINPEGRPCRCGSTGCWETEAGEAALLRHAKGFGNVTGLDAVDSLSERAKAGDAAVLGAFATLGRWLGVGIGNLINLFNPELVVLGGLYHRFYEYLEDATIEGARSRALEAPWSVVKVTRGRLGIDAPLIGAAELALSPTVADPASVNVGSSRRSGKPRRSSVAGSVS